MHRTFCLILAVAVPVTACGGASQPCDSSLAETVVQEEVAQTNATSPLNLNAVLWVQTAGEYATLTTQSFRLASAQLRAGLEDTSWTASPEQVAGYEALPPAVIMDLDETVLDNSPYQAWLVENGDTFSSASWDAWCEAEQAGEVPGALAFVQDAVDLGVTVFFVSNRTGAVEAATRANLEALGFGFALRDDIDNVLLKREQDDWGSNKGTRRMVVGETHRIVLSIGDNLGDFFDGYKVSVEDRNEIISANDDAWGTRWIVLPNPTYGSWEQTLYEFDYGLDPEAQEAAKREHLRPWNP